MKSRTQTAACLALLLRSASTASTTKPNSFNWDDTKYLLAFGDSYTYVQGTHGLTNYSFIGSYEPATSFAYTPTQLLSNRIVQNFTGTAEGGPNWVEYLTGCGVVEGLTAPAECNEGLQLWDFAFAGADVSIEFTPQHHNWTVPLVNQTDEFLQYAQPVFDQILHIDPAQTLVAIWIGINDISDTADEGYDFPEFYNDIIATVFNHSVASLYDAGYRHFLVVNLPPLDRTPGNVGKADPSPNKTQIAWWDNALAEHSEAFVARGHDDDDARVMLFDANTFLNGVLDNATEMYGITNTTGFCAGYLYEDVLTDWEQYGCSGPLETYFWFNSGHMTSRVHEILAPEIARFLRDESRK